MFGFFQATAENRLSKLLLRQKTKKHHFTFLGYTYIHKFINAQWGSSKHLGVLNIFKSKCLVFAHFWSAFDEIFMTGVKLQIFCKNFFAKYDKNNTFLTKQNLKGWTVIPIPHMRSYSFTPRQGRSATWPRKAPIPRDSPSEWC